MKLLYIANARIPTEKAHGLQIMKMCEAFASQSVEVELVVPRRVNSIKKDPFLFYAVRNNFFVRKVWCIDFLALPFLKTAGFWIESVSFAVAAAYFAVRHAVRQSMLVYYTRDALVALML